MNTAAIEDHLAAHCHFGDPTYIFACLTVLIRKRLARLSPEFDTAWLTGALESARAAELEIIHDPVVRVVVDQALLITRGEEARLPLPLLQRVLRDETALWGEDRSTWSVQLQAQRRARLWRPGASTASAAEAFTHLLSELVPLLQFCSPPDDERQNLEIGARLLQRVVPRLADSTLCHVKLVTVAETNAKILPGETIAVRTFRSATLAALPGTIMVSRQRLASPWSAAAALLHEALHLKFIDLEYTHTLGPAASHTGAIPTITPPWHAGIPGREPWQVKRAMTALHVYVGLSLLYQRFQADESLEAIAQVAKPVELAEYYETAVTRARYLAAELVTRAHALGPAGRSFVSWLDTLVHSLKLESVTRPEPAQTALAS